jgi:hypothetical protein
VILELNKIWNPRPVSLFILEALEKKGSMSDIDLQKELESNFGEVNFRELNRELMKLEMAGMVWVSRLAKGKRLVELTGKIMSG